MTDERDWARTSSTYKPSAGEAKPPSNLSTMDTARILGSIGLYLTLAPPAAVILWRLATAPWP